MKFASITAILSLAVLTANCLPAYAEQCASDDLYCVSVTGLSDNVKDGRFLKVVLGSKGEIAGCTGNGAFVEIPAGLDAQYVGSHTYQYFICKNSTGKDCVPVDTGSYTVSRNKNGRYSTNPKNHKIDLASYKNQFPQCDASVPPTYP